jgi:hypothetical protein
MGFVAITMLNCASQNISTISSSGTAAIGVKGKFSWRNFLLGNGMGNQLLG